MSTTSLQSPQKATSPAGLTSSSTSEKPSFLRSALPMDEPVQEKGTGMHRMWKSAGVVVAEEKLAGEEGERVVVQAW
jgi:hypothetical protein